MGGVVFAAAAGARVLVFIGRGPKYVRRAGALLGDATA